MNTFCKLQPYFNIKDPTTFIKKELGNSMPFNKYILGLNLNGGVHSAETKNCFVFTKPRLHLKRKSCQIESFFNRIWDSYNF